MTGSTLLVIEQGVGTRPRLDDALALLEAGGSEPVGIVLNRTRHTVAGRMPAASAPHQPVGVPAWALPPTPNTAEPVAAAARCRRADAVVPDAVPAGRATRGGSAGHRDRPGAQRTIPPGATGAEPQPVRGEIVVGTPHLPPGEFAGDECCSPVVASAGGGRHRTVGTPARDRSRSPAGLSPDHSRPGRAHRLRREAPRPSQPAPQTPLRRSPSRHHQRRSPLRRDRSPMRRLRSRRLRSRRHRKRRLRPRKHPPRRLRSRRPRSRKHLPRRLPPRRRRCRRQNRHPSHPVSSPKSSTPSERRATSTTRSPPCRPRPPPSSAPVASFPTSRTRRRRRSSARS